jgi:hypothetical protein
MTEFGGHSTLFGDAQLGELMQFHDLADGDYTICVAPLRREKPLPILCRTATISGQPPVIELELGNP